MGKANVIGTLTLIVAVFFLNQAYSMKNQDYNKPHRDEPVILEVEDVVCSVGTVHNLISNSTSERATGTNDWTIMIGDDSNAQPSMIWTQPEEYASNNHYLYFGSLRIGYRGHQVILAPDTSSGSTGIDVLEPPESISDFDTHFYLTDTLDIVPEDYRVGIRVDQNTYAWSADDADDFIIYQYWIHNLTEDNLDSVYVALHMDCDISTAEGGAGNQFWSRDDMVSYYRNDDAGEYISYMYDADNPNVDGDDFGGRLDPKESAGYIGSRLIYCSHDMNGEETVQSGHSWWDWNSDPSDDDAFADWIDLMDDGYWMDDTPSPHDFRYLQKTGPFSINAGDSIRVVFALGIGEGLHGLRSNLNSARLLFENGYAYYDLPPDVPVSFDADVSGLDIEFTWDEVTNSDLDGYNIYMATDEAGPFQIINSGLIEDNFYSYSPSTRDIYYFYLTSVDNTDNESITTDTVVVSTMPVPPSNFRVIPNDNYVTMYWNTVEDADLYTIFRADVSGGPYTQVVQVAPQIDTYVDNYAVNYNTYYYVITSTDDNVESPYSGEVEATPSPNDIENGRVLLVDDYVDRDENDNPLDYQYRRRFYERWGVHHFDYDIWVVADSGSIPDSATILNYQAVLFASDGDVGTSDDSWWYEVGFVNGGTLRHYLENGGHLLAIGQLIIMYCYNNNPPLPGDFEYDWFGVDSTEGWDYWSDFTWAVNAGNVDILPDSMKIDVAKNEDQVDYAINVFSFRDSAVSLFNKGLDIDGEESYDYGQSVGHIFYVDGEPVTSLINFSLYYMPNEASETVMSYILREVFGCTYYEDPAPLPPWEVMITAVSDEEIKVYWQPVDEDDVTAINVYRAIADSEFELYATLDPAICEYSDIDINPGDTYNYRLICVDFAGQESEYSHTVTEYGGRSLPPLNLRADAEDYHVDLTWTIPDDVTIDSFRIYQSDVTRDNFRHVKTLPASDSTASISDDIYDITNYHFYVTSLSTYGVESYSSDTVSAFTYHSNYRVPQILVVNGVDWISYSYDIFNFYRNGVPVGDQYEYRFWDLFGDTPNFGDIGNIYDSLCGVGDVPPEVFDAFKTIVWVGNYYNGDLEYWLAHEQDIMDYLNSNGNLLLLTRRAHYFFFEDLWNWCGVTSYNEGSNPDYLVAVHDYLSDIDDIGSQSYFETIVSENSNTIQLFETDDGDAGAGFFTQGPDRSGNFAFIGGRPYRWDNDDLRENVDVVLSYFFDFDTDVEETEPAIPDKFMLSQNYPNPFNPVTSIMYGVPNKSHVKLEVYDILGRKVNTLVDSQMDAGYHTVIWNGETSSGESVASGIYFYRLSAGDYTESKKMTILK